MGNDLVIKFVARFPTWFCAAVTFRLTDGAAEVMKRRRQVLSSVGNGAALAGEVEENGLADPQAGLG